MARAVTHLFLILFFVFALPVSCLAASPVLMGEVRHSKLTELSGMVASANFPGLFWAINDGGHPAQLFLMQQDGSTVARYSVNAKNKDWEAMTIAQHQGRSYLVIADTGNNRLRRKTLSFYWAEEPTSLNTADKTLKVVKTQKVRFPKGPVDAEAVAYDRQKQVLLVASKRKKPNIIYQIPWSDGDTTLTAEAVVSLDRLEADRRKTPWLERARRHHHRPTDMALNKNGDLALLTYDRIYFWMRHSKDSIKEQLSRDPLIRPLPPLRQAEAITFIANGKEVLVSGEDRRPALWKIPLPTVP